jgi:hypothetical protein
MRKRTWFGVLALVFAVPALASEPVRSRPEAATAEGGPSVCFELRFLKLPTAFYRELNVKLPDSGLLSAEEAKKLLEAAQLCRRASVMQCPKITAASGQAVPLSVRDERTFVTGVEATKVKGATVLVPQNKHVSLGTSASVVGRISAGGDGVGVQIKLVRTWLAGEPELVPVVTKITPVFEGGSVGQPVPFTQYIQAPDVRTAAAERSAIVPSGGTLLVGVWSETEEEKNAGRKAKPEAVEYTCVALATVRVVPAGPAVAPMPRAVPPVVTKVYPVGDIVGPAARGGVLPACGSAEQLVKVVTEMVRPYSWQPLGGSGTAEYFEIGSALVVKNSPDVLNEVGDLLEAMRRQLAESAAPEARPAPQMQPPEPLPLVRNDAATRPQPKEGQKAEVFRLRNVAAADAVPAVATYLAQRGLKARVTADPVTNGVLVSGEPALRRQVIALLEKLDTAPAQVTVTATVVRVPRAFVARCGLSAGGAADAKSWTLSARESHMLTELLRGAKGRGECDVLARPQICVADGQAGIVQVGQRSAAAQPAGATQRVSFEQLPVSLALELTPRVLSGGRGMVLATHLRLAEKKGAGTRDQTLRATAQIRCGETLVLASAEAGSFCGAPECTRCGDSPVTLVILTPTLK